MEINTYLKAAFCISCVIAGFLGGCSYKQRELNRIKEDYAEQVQAGLQANRDLEQRMADSTHAIATEYQAQKAQSDKTIEQLKMELANAKKSNPMPAVCRLDDDRMRIIKAAVNHANNPRP